MSCSKHHSTFNEQSYNNQENNSRKTKYLIKCKLLSLKFEKRGVHSSIALQAAGFRYTGTGDTAICATCQLTVSNWKENMIPFTTHAELSPNCSFVLSIRPTTIIKSLSTSPSKISTSSNDSMTSDNTQGTVKTREESPMPSFKEVRILQEIRLRTFSHWDQQESPRSDQMIEAGFFCCNVNDRVICIYCNLICQAWRKYTDDPYEVHLALSPNCIFVKTMIARRNEASIPILNDPSAALNTNVLSADRMVYTNACNSLYVEIPKRYQSFANWSEKQMPSVDQLVRAGFFYTGQGSIVTCFYCNGSLQNWGLADDPIREHVRWFPTCMYARQVAGEDLYKIVQESNRIYKEHLKTNTSSSNSTTSERRLHILDENTLSRYVAARLDLSIEKHLVINNEFKSSIVKRCIEDQIRIKKDDFLTCTDLFVACLILRSQIVHINGNKDKIIVPSIHMKNVKTTQQTLESTEPTVVTSQLVKTETNICKKASTTSSATITKDTTDSTDQSSTTTCALCLTEQRQLACMPCGHMATCVPCGHSLRSCPLCRKSIQGFIRIYF